MPTPETELLDLSQKLLDAITAGDWTTYAALCDEHLTCFEPEAQGHLVTGLPFHKFYFDLPGGGGGPRQSTIAAPSVRVMGDVGIVCYVRLVQKLVDGAPVTAAVNETRIWQRTPQGWKHIHFHRSVV